MTVGNKGKVLKICPIISTVCLLNFFSLLYDIMSWSTCNLFYIFLYQLNNTIRDGGSTTTYNVHTVQNPSFTLRKQYGALMPRRLYILEWADGHWSKILDGVYG